MKRMRKLSAVFALLVLVAVSMLLNVDLTDSKAESSGEDSRTLPCAAYREHHTNAAPGGAIPVLKDSRASVYEVLEVIDGDTIAVAKGGKTRVRLMGMDTPERTTTRNGQVEHFGEEAYRHALGLIESSGWQVRLSYDKVTTDRYGRDLAYVWLKDGRMLNAVLVADGYAYSYTSSPKPEYVDLFLVLMRTAREGGRGLWAKCG